MLVSCILPTRDRREYIAQAVACFLSQTYTMRELVVVDNGNPVRDLIPSGLNVIYKHVGDEPLTVGEMRNRACELARGELIAHWDDDDWSHPARLREQVRLLIGAGAAVTGYHNMTFVDEDTREAWLYQSGGGYALGTSLVYTRPYWRANRFRTTDEDGKPMLVGEDGAFIQTAQRKGTLAAVDVTDRMLARIHSKNTCKKNYKSLPMWQPIPYEAAAAIAGGTVCA